MFEYRDILGSVVLVMDDSDVVCVVTESLLSSGPGAPPVQSLIVLKGAQSPIRRDEAVRIANLLKERHVQKEKEARGLTRVGSADRFPGESKLRENFERQIQERDAEGQAPGDRLRREEAQVDGLRVSELRRVAHNQGGNSSDDTGIIP